MSELHAKARSLIQAIQFADDPTEAEFDRVSDAVNARIRLGVAAVVLTTAATSAGSSSAASTVGAAASSAASNTATLAAAASSAGIGGAWVLKALAVAVVTGAMAGTGVVLVSRRTAPSIPSASSTATRPPPAFRADPPTERSDPFARAAPEASSARPSEAKAASMVAIPLMSAAPTAAISIGATPGPVRAKAIPGTPSLVAAPAETPEEIRRNEPLDEEIAQLRAARSSLHDGRPTEALRQLDESAMRFPAGVLAEDREAERIFTLCALGRADDASVQAERFLTLHPRSSYAGSIRSSCALETDKLRK